MQPVILFTPAVWYQFDSILTLAEATACNVKTVCLNNTSFESLSHASKNLKVLIIVLLPLSGSKLFFFRATTSAEPT